MHRGCPRPTRRPRCPTGRTPRHPSAGSRSCEARRAPPADVRPRSRAWASSARDARPTPTIREPARATSVDSRRPRGEGSVTSGCVSVSRSAMACAHVPTSAACCRSCPHGRAAACKRQPRQHARRRPSVSPPPRHASTSVTPTPTSHHAHGSTAATRMSAGKGKVRSHAAPAPSQTRAPTSRAPHVAAPAASSTSPISPRSPRSRADVAASVDTCRARASASPDPSQQREHDATVRVPRVAFVWPRRSAVAHARCPADGPAASAALRSRAITGAAPSGDDPLQPAKGAAAATRAPAGPRCRPAGQRGAAPRSGAPPPRQRTPPRQRWRRRRRPIGQTSRPVVTWSAMMASRAEPGSTSHAALGRGPACSRQPRVVRHAECHRRQDRERPRATAPRCGRCVQCARPARDLARCRLPLPPLSCSRLLAPRHRSSSGSPCWSRRR